MVDRHFADEKTRNNSCLHLWAETRRSCRSRKNAVPALRSDIREAVGIINGALPPVAAMG